MPLLNPWHIVGLVEGEGCFCICISRHKTKKLGFDARMMFEIEMIIDDNPLLTKLQKVLRCGQIYQLNYERYGWRPHVKFAVKKFDDIQNRIIPFFLKYKLQGKKGKDFLLFCRAAKIFEKKRHLTKTKMVVRHGAGKPRAGWGEKIKQRCLMLSQNTARQASEVGKGRNPAFGGATPGSATRTKS